MSILIEIKNKTQCCGCTACAEICPVHCIEMKEDTEGFKYPKVETNKCINCGACERTCPELNYRRRVSFQEKAYLVQNKNQRVLKESTSGGAFTAIAEYVIENGGIVYGAVMDPDTMFVHHVGVDKEDELCEFRNSKYVQSDVGTCFLEAKECLQKNRLVCFSGTPCQIEGFKGFLGSSYSKYKDNLILVDVVCRAVPSPGVWEKYVDDIKQRHGNIESVRFRDKELGYQYSTMVIKTEDGVTQRDGIETSMWLRMFFSGIIIRPSCTECKFRSPYRRSDITLWDCFPTYRFDKTIDEDAGTTRMLVHSGKGFEVLKAIQSQLKIEKLEVEDAISGVREMRLSPDMNEKREDFYETVHTEGLLVAERRYFSISKKVQMKRNIRNALHKLGADKKVKHILNKG